MSSSARDCIHGNQARACPVCELRRDTAELLGVVREVRRRWHLADARACYLALLLWLSGCGSIPQPSRAELVWQAIHAIDTAQTVQLAGAPDCYHEATPFTRSLIGKHPSVAGAFGWGVGTAALHFGVSRWLEAVDAPMWSRWVWQGVTITDSAAAVANNFDQGVGVTSADCGRSVSTASTRTTPRQVGRDTGFPAL